MQNALIIADYSENTGMGHLMRCASLAKELAGSLSVKFASNDKEYFKKMKGFVSKIGCRAELFEDFSGIGAKESAGLVVIDSYKATAKFLTDIKKYYDVCVVVDDNARLSFYDADFIINQNIGAEKLGYKARKDTEFLLGPEYLMLREDFAETGVISITDEVTDIVITMGGADVKNITKKTLILLEKRKQFNFHVVVGPDFKNKEFFDEYQKKNNNIVIHYNANMPELFAKCQGAVSACGSTVYELASFGVPTIGIITADNQQNVSIEMENEGIMLSAGLAEKFSPWYFDKLFVDVMMNSEFRVQMHQKQRALIKKDGAKRVAERLLARLT